MFSEHMERALNEQINAELFSSYLYLSMAAYFESLNLEGFASWMKMQSDEETMHAMKFYDYIHSRGGRVVLTAIGEPQKDWDSPKDAFEAALEHERMITGRINDLVAIADSEKDNASHHFLMWFVTEQVEEEESVGNVVSKLELVADHPGGLFMMDRELAKRSVTTSSDNA
jgi:ferritin